MICRICKKNKLENEFYKAPRNLSGYDTQCKICYNIQIAEYRKKNIDKYKIYQKKYYQENHERLIKYYTEYRSKNRNQIRQSQYRWEYRHKNDTIFKFKKALRTRLKGAIKNNQKSGSAVRDLGCSVPELKQWLEQQFKPGMTWENYGSKWHIDHIIPLSHFDLTDRKQLLKACHWFNLQPLWAEQNISKSNRLC